VAAVGQTEEQLKALEWIILEVSFKALGRARARRFRWFLLKLLLMQNR
jgi:pyruvate/2-oxoglutarate dehydrogenase complex dihydrolipoamide dehydrogenase (E3) component